MVKKGRVSKKAREVREGSKENLSMSSVYLTRVF